MPVEPRFVPRFVAEPPQEPLPYGRWADRRSSATSSAPATRSTPTTRSSATPARSLFYPDRTWHGRTFVPATARTSNGFELFGYVSFRPGGDDREPTDFDAVADFTDDTADANPDWQLDLCDEVVGSWRGEDGNVAAMTLVWGRPLVARRRDRHRRARRPGRRPVRARRGALHAAGARRLPRRHAGHQALRREGRRSSRASRCTRRRRGREEQGLDAMELERRSARGARTRPTAPEPWTARRSTSSSSSPAGRRTTSSRTPGASASSAAGARAPQGGRRRSDRRRQARPRADARRRVRDAAGDPLIDEEDLRAAAAPPTSSCSPRTAAAWPATGARPACCARPRGGRRSGSPTTSRSSGCCTSATRARSRGSRARAGGRRSSTLPGLVRASRPAVERQCAFQAPTCTGVRSTRRFQGTRQPTPLRHSRRGSCQRRKLGMRSTLRRLLCPHVRAARHVRARGLRRR